MDVKIRLALLRKIGSMHPGFWLAITAEGEIEGDKLRISQERFQALNVEHFGRLAPGNIIHEVAEPIAKVIGIADCSGCAERQLKANALGSF